MIPTTGSRLPDFGGNFLQPGCSVIHFYYNDLERRRFASFVSEGLSLRQSVVVAAPANVADLLIRGTTAATPPHQASVTRVELKPDLHESVRRIALAVHSAAKHSGMVRLLVDFAGHASAGEIFQIEATLSTALLGVRLMTVTQYDGTTISAPITVEQFKTHSLAIVGDAFYYENHNHITPEAYVKKRAAAAAAATTGR